MKKKLKLSQKSNLSVLHLLTFLLFFSFANAATITSTSTGGTWSTGGSWVGGIAPVAGDNVVIVAGATITVTASTSITNLNLSTTTSKLVINSGQTLTVSGTFANSGTTTNGVNGPGTILFTGTATFGVLTATGTAPNVTIGNGSSTNTVTLGASSVIVGNLITNTGATFNISTRNPFTVNGTYTNGGTTTGTSARIALTGNFTNSGTFGLTTGWLTISTGNFSNSNAFNLTTGTLDITSGNFSNTGTLAYTGAGNLKLGGGYTNSGTVTFVSANVQFTGAATQSMPSFTTTGTVSMLKTGGTVTFTGNVNGGALTINGSGGTLNLGSGLTHVFTGTWTRTIGTMDCNTSTLTMGGTITNTAGTFTANLANVIFSRGGTQSPPGVTYNNITLSGSGLKTFPTSPTINGLLSIEGTATAAVTSGSVIYGTNATLQYNTATARTISATSAEWITPFAATGGVVIANTGKITLNAAKTFNATAPLTVNSLAKLGLGTVLLTLNGNFVNNGTATGTTGGVTITGTASTQSIGPFTTTGTVSMTKTSGTATFTGAVNGAGLTINGTGGTLNLGTALTHTFTGVTTLTSGTLNGGSSTLKINATSATAWNGTGSNFTAGTSTVNFGGGNQTLVTSSTFYNLTFSTSGTKTLTGAPTVTNILSMEGTAAVSGTPVYGTSATLQYNRTATQNTGAEWIATFAATGGVSIINTGTITLIAAKAFNSTVPLSIGTGATLDGSTFAITGGSTLTIANGGFLKLGGTTTFPTFTNASLGSTSTVNYTGTAQAVPAKNYGNLSLSGSGNKTFAAGTTIAGIFDISGTAVALLPNTTTSSASSVTFAGVAQASGSWGGSTSPATNKNATRFGSTTTGIINNGACSVGTWLGSFSTDWNTPGNWCGSVLPTATTDVIIASATLQPVLTSSGLCKNIAIETGGTLSLGSNTLTVSGNWTKNGGTFTAGTGTVVFNGTASQSIGGTSSTTFNNLTNSNTSADVTAGIGITVNGTLAISNALSALEMSTFVLSAGGSFSNTGSGQIRTSNSSSLPIPSGKTWACDIQYNLAGGGQTVVAGTYNGTPSLELNNTSGTQTASGNITTGGELRLDNPGTPTLSMNGFNLTANKLNISSSSILDMLNGALSYTTLIAMDGTTRFSGATNGLAFPSGTVEYYGSGQTVASGTYDDLLFSGSGGSYSIASNIDVADTLTVTNGALTLQDSMTITLGDVLTVTSPGTLTLENNANLIQTCDTCINSGNVNVKRNTTPVIHDDYTYWSAPTTGTQTLAGFSPTTQVDKFFTYHNAWTYAVPSSTTFTPGIGYAIRWEGGAVTPTVAPHQFTGIPNNGDVSVSVTKDPVLAISNRLIGNPYPSAIDADAFINTNTAGATPPIDGTLYLWTHNHSLSGTNYSSSDYATYTTAGGTRVSTGTGNTTDPTQYITSGQAFFVHTINTGTVTFDNSMRVGSDNTNFYKLANPAASTLIERHRIWMNLTNAATSNFSQAMLAYMENATNGVDLGIDGLYYGSDQFVLYSLIDSGTYTIQGRALPFTDTDTVPLGYKVNTAGDATISIDHVDGLFLDDQNIYLEDLLLNVTHDLKASPYVFNSEVGTFNNRFVLKYTEISLGTPTTQINNSVIVAKDKQQLIVKSQLEPISKISVYDVVGRKVFDKEAINANNFNASDITTNQQALIVKVTLTNGQIVTKKIIY